MNSIAKKYCKQVSKCISFSGKSKSDIFSIIRVRIEQFIEDNPSATYDDIVKEFGTPEDIVKTFLETEESSQLQHLLSVRKRVVGIILILGIIIFATLTILIINYNFKDGNFVEVIQEDSIPETLSSIIEEQQF